MSKAIVLYEVGGPENPKWEDVEVGEAGDHRALGTIENLVD